MPWGWECRAKLIKQVPPKPVERRGEPKAGLPGPAPNQYEPPKIVGGPGFDRIKRAPAYSFGLRTKLISGKTNLSNKARMLNVQGMVRQGGAPRITHSVVTPRIEPVTTGTATPGPVYNPPPDSRVRRPPSYSIQAAQKPPYVPQDMWTPPPNMYCPLVMSKMEPAYSLGPPVRLPKQPQIPGPGEHDPNYNYVKKSKPAYSFGAPFTTLKPKKSPAPNTYCEKKFMYPLKRNPAPTFGIRHSPYLGMETPYLKPPSLEVAISKY